MAKLTRKHQKIFCDVAPTNKLGVFGSLAAGSPAYSDDPDTIQSLTAYGAGLGSALINNAPPAIQDIDGLCNLTSRQIAYLLQTGIPEYNASVTYYIGSIVNNGTDALFVSVADDNINNALSVTTKWMLFKSKKVRRETGFVVNPPNYDDYTVEMDGSTAGGFDPLLFYLPTPTSTNRGRVVIVKNLFSGGSIQVYGGTGGETIDGAAFISLTGIYTKGMYISNGANWEKII
jgi:gamma-glutamyltranspeptidase